MARSDLLAVVVRCPGAGTFSDARYSARSDSYTGAAPEPDTDTTYTLQDSWWSGRPFEPFSSAVWLCGYCE